MKHICDYQWQEYNAMRLKKMRRAERNEKLTRYACTTLEAMLAAWLTASAAYVVYLVFFG